MKNGTYILREKPKFEIELSTDSIKIIDGSLSQSSLTYKFDELDKFEIREKRTNWLITILSFVLEMLSSISTSGKYSESSQLHLGYMEQTHKYYLNDCNLNLLGEIENNIKHRIQ
nr:hypothetical protein [uncultured Allomuricauda sp.]